MYTVIRRLRSGSYDSCFSWRAGVLFGALCFTTSALSAAEFAAADLPSWRTDEVGNAATIATLSSANAASAALTLINPTAGHFKGGVDHYEIDPNAKAGRWPVVAVDKKQTRTTLGTFAATGDKLTFTWEKSPSRPLASGLRNCVLVIAAGGAEQRVALRAPQIVEPAMLDFRKDFLTFAVKGEDLPDDSALRVEVLNLESAPSTAMVEKKVLNAKEPQFIVLKPTEPEVPGVRLRLLLSENGSQMNVLIRPELTPAKPDTAMPALVSLPATGIVVNGKNSGKTSGIPKSTTTTKPTTIKPSTSSSASAAATASASEPNLLFTTRKLTESKNQIQGQLNTCKQRILFDKSAILQREAELNRIPDVLVGTVDEIAAAEARIARLQSEIRQLRNEVTQLENLLPELDKKLAAFPPLEKLGAAMQLKTAVSLRVFYEVGTDAVDVLRIGK